MNAGRSHGSSGLALTSGRGRLVVFVDRIHAGSGRRRFWRPMVLSAAFQRATLSEGWSIEIAWLHRGCRRSPAYRGVAGVVECIDSGIGQMWAAVMQSCQHESSVVPMCLDDTGVPQRGW